MLKIFISYSQDDYSPGARHVRNYISKYIQNSDVFIDQSKPKGSKWKKEIEENLEASDIFVVILTHGALQSDEVSKEVELAKKRKDRKIVPCKENLLEIGWEDVPWNLSEYDGIEFEDKEELGRRLVTAIKKIVKLETPSEGIASMTMSGSLPIDVPSGLPQNLNFTITNGEVLSVQLDREALAIILSLASFEDGKLKLTLPRSIIDAKFENQDDDFFVLIDGIESNYTEETTNFERILSIPFLKGDSEVEVIGTEILGISSIGASKEENVVKLVKGSSSPKSNEKYLEPQTLIVKSGDKVKWVNVDDAAHTVTSGDITGEGPDGLFDSSLIGPGKTFEVTFNRKGAYRYFCMVHPWTEGKIIVE